jgi:hypothetical protein
MRQRTIALAAIALLAVPAMTSCRRPPPVSSIPAGKGQSCGTITNGQVTEAPSNTNYKTPASCWLQYHTFAEVYITIVKGSETTRVQTQDHIVSVYRQNGAGKVLQCSGFAQVTLSDTGVFLGACNPT